ncbi:MAG: hypothetical protein AAF081_07845 [Actinomycetota bacterium]
MPRRWKQQVEAELIAPLERGAAEIAIEVPARRAGTARRRMRWMTEHLRPHGYEFDVFEPRRRPDTGGFGVAHFRRSAS